MTNENTVTRYGVERKSFGFFHPNTFAMFTVFLYFEYIFVNILPLFNPSNGVLSCEVLLKLIFSIFIFVSFL